jgi:hypothetical protein
MVGGGDFVSGEDVADCDCVSLIGWVADSTEKTFRRFVLQIWWSWMHGNVEIRRRDTDAATSSAFSSSLRQHRPRGSLVRSLDP